MTVELNGSGWDPVTFDEVRAVVVQLWTTTIDANADTSPESPDGLEITIIATLLTLGFDINTALWASSFFRSAPGQALDNILDLFGHTRAPATSSIATEVFYGTPGTAVPIGSQVLTADSSANRFATDAVGAVGAASASETWVVRIIPAGGVAVVNETYLVTVDANPPSDYGAVVTDTVTIIAAGLRDAINGDGFAVASLAGVDSLGNALIVVETTIASDVVASSTFVGPAIIDDLEAGRVAMTATETGPLLAAAGTLQSIATPVVGIVGASNDVDAATGTNQETDDEFRSSHLQTLWSNTTRTDQGMQAAVAALGDGTTGVLDNLVRSNRTFSPTDADGRPIGSAENIILTDGTVPDADIANAIARSIAAGVEPYGQRSFGLGTTVDGEIIEVFATDVEELFLHLDVTVTPGEGFPVGDISQAVASAISNYYNLGLLQSASGMVTYQTAILVIGKDMTRTSAVSPINSVTNSSATGILILTAVTTTPNDVPVFVATDQPATDRQIVRASAARITVTVTP